MGIFILILSHALGAFPAHYSTAFRVNAACAVNVPCDFRYVGGTYPHGDAGVCYAMFDGAYQAIAGYAKVGSQYDLQVYNAGLSPIAAGTGFVVDTVCQ